MKKITRLTESDLRRLVKKVLKEENKKELKPISIEMIKEYILMNLEGYDVSNNKTKRRLSFEIDELAHNLYDMFIYKLNYMSEDDGIWKNFLKKIEID